MKNIFLILIFIISSTWANDTYIYNNSVGGRVSKITWTVKLSEDKLHITGDSRSGKTVVVTTPERVSKSFSYHASNGKDKYSIMRKGPTLIANKEIDGNPQEKHFNIKEGLWIQEFVFSLKPFILSNAQTYKFSIIHPSQLDLHDMVATKQALTKLDLNGTSREAIAVKITLAGFKKLFWHADLWFDPQSGDLLKYMGTEGPNTPLSIISFVSKHTDSK